MSDLRSSVDSSLDMSDSSLKASLLDYASPTVEQVLSTLQSAEWDFFLC